MAESDLSIINLTKTYDRLTAVDRVSFTVPQGSFFSILGPSGCGKTTLLRMLAGFISPDSGDICIGGTSVLNLPPNRRPINMVFQHLALFPNMTVAENVAYGLRRRGLDKAEIAQRVQKMLARVSLPDAGPKQIDQLSGGQKQRIAIARCLVLEPALLLLDEPLGALDLKLREHMKIELKQLQAEIGTTFVYITHDQSEALVMSDHVAVMNRGRLEQIGTPQELYYKPKSAFVAGFVGVSNRLNCRIVSHNNAELILETQQGLNLHSSAIKIDKTYTGSAVAYVRPEAILIARDHAAVSSFSNQIEAKIGSILFDGANSSAILNLPQGESLMVALPQDGRMSMLQVGETVHIGWHPEATLCFPENTV
ncbi:MAG: ABC transporter ATP-binding protein [Alphaproteobacteria bacterium]